MFETRSAADKRKTLRDGLASGRLLQFPGAFSPLIAMEIERIGFDGVYISGAALAADLGLPDIGLTTLHEVASRGHQIARATDLPCLIDADTGFGEPMNVARTVRMLEDMGIAACHIEDQVNPKRCGHLDHKSVVPAEVMVQRLKAAVSARRDENFTIIARTDSRALEGLDAAIERAKAYVGAGADIIFPEALENRGEFEKFRSSISVPLLANMTEFGKSPLLPASDLEELGYNIVIYPVTALRLAVKAAADGLRTIRETGTQRQIVNSMQTRAELYEMLRYGDYNRFDETIYNFKLPGPGAP